MARSLKIFPEAHHNHHNILPYNKKKNMIAPPQYTITTAIGEECHHLNFFTNLNIERESTIDELIFIKLKDKSTFSILKSDWISIQRQLKLNKLIK
jgi:hypothetical protein